LIGPRGIKTGISTSIDFGQTVAGCIIGIIDGTVDAFGMGESAEVVIAEALASGRIEVVGDGGYVIYGIQGIDFIVYGGDPIGSPP